MLSAPRADLAVNTLAYETQPLVKATGFREYDARWLFGPDLNLLGVEALGLGLVDRVTTAEELLPAAVQVAKSMGENPQVALGMVKSLITANMAESDMLEAQRREMEALLKCYESAEHKEAIAAFLEKRAPDFKAARG